ncbi:hypothetical protein, partial [Dysosmobacter sp.]|uniref:hypothetical protein n=1 Tax=Dysosmobacter sp. TaxID=2591382 RepID=UPI003AB79EDE
SAATDWRFPQGSGAARVSFDDSFWSPPRKQKNKPEHPDMLRPDDELRCEMKKGAFLMASTKPTNRRPKDRIKF